MSINSGAGRLYGQTTPGGQTVENSGTVTLLPGGSVTFTFPLPAVPPGGRPAVRQFPIYALNQSDQTATVTLQGLLTIELPPAYSIQFVPPQTACRYGGESNWSMVTGPTNIASCETGFGDEGGTYTFTAVPRVSAAVGTTALSHSAGWNLTAGPLVYRQAEGGLYTYHEGDSAYELVPPSTTAPPSTTLVPGRGYWAYYDAAGSDTLALSGPQSASVPVDAGQYVMIGNPGTTEAIVSGAAVFYVYDAESGQYVESSTLQPGQGAWAYSALGGTVTIAGQ